jgi:hypothetical protein
MPKFSTFWRTDRGLTVLVVFLVLGLLVVPPLRSAGVISSALVDAVFSFILISGVATVSGSRWATILAAALALLTLGVRWYRFGSGAHTLAILDPALTVLTLLTLAGLVLYRVLRRGRVTVHRIQGAVAAYLLFGLAWARAYELVHQLLPGAFRFPDASDPQLMLLYYSFVTLTTVGYGDVTPVLPAARSLAVAEALVGQLFPAILIARLVSLELVSSGARDAKAGDV